MPECGSCGAPHEALAAVRPTEERRLRAALSVYEQLGAAPHAARTRHALEAT